MGNIPRHPIRQMLGRAGDDLHDARRVDVVDLHPARVLQSPPVRSDKGYRLVALFHGFLAFSIKASSCSTVTPKKSATFASVSCSDQQPARHATVRMNSCAS